MKTPKIPLILSLLLIATFSLPADDDGELIVVSNYLKGIGHDYSLNQLRHLEILDMGDAQKTYAELRILLVLKKLRKLSFYPGLTPEGRIRSNFATVLKRFESLEEVDITGPSISERALLQFERDLPAITVRQPLSPIEKQQFLTAQTFLIQRDLHYSLETLRYIEILDLGALPASAADLEKLTVLTNLKTLAVNPGPAIPPNFVALLKRWPHLQSLRFTTTDIPAPELVRLEQALPFSVDLARSFARSLARPEKQGLLRAQKQLARAGLFYVLERLRYLEELNLGQKIQTAGTLAELAGLENLRTLVLTPRLASSGFVPAGFSTALKRFERLRRLDLAQTDITEQALTRLENGLPNHVDVLRSLSKTRKTALQQAQKYLASGQRYYALERLRYLERLDLGARVVGPVELRRLHVLSYLQSLDLNPQRNAVGQIDPNLYAALQGFEVLQRLSVVAEVAARTVVDLEQRLPRLEIFTPLAVDRRLELLATQKFLAAQDLFYPLERLRDLEVLDLGEREIQIDVLQKILNLSRLHTLYLNPGLNANGAVDSGRIKSLGKLSGLRTLGLANSGITASGLAQLERRLPAHVDVFRVPDAESRRGWNTARDFLADRGRLYPLEVLRHLQVLDLSAKKVSALDVRKLSGLKKLHVLYLQPDKAVAPDLAAGLGSLQELRLLGLKSAGLTTAVLAQWERVLPLTVRVLGVGPAKEVRELFAAQSVLEKLGRSYSRDFLRSLNVLELEALTASPESLKSLTALRNLRTLRLQRPPTVVANGESSVDPGMVRALGRLTGLEELQLRISSGGVSDQIVSELENALPSVYVVSLLARRASRDLKYVKMFLENKNRDLNPDTLLPYTLLELLDMRELDLRLKRVTDDDLAKFLSLGSLRSILMEKRKNAPDVTGKGVCALRSLAHLERLQLDGFDLGYRDLRCIGDFPQLKKLSIRRTKITGKRYRKDLERLLIELKESVVVEYK